MVQEYEVREIREDEVFAARRMLATAFAGEAFAIGMFGAEPLGRFLGMMDQYASWPFSAAPVTFAAVFGGNLLGVATATLPGQCHLCDESHDLLPRTASVADRIEHEFQLACRRAHNGADLPAHAHITSVAVEGILRGGGVGRRLVDRLLSGLWSSGASCAVLECVTVRAPFYERLGFRVIDEFADPGAPGLRSVLMRCDTSSGEGQAS